jgi:hypothetical protein
MMRRWEIKAYNGQTLVLHTWHTTESSRDSEIAAFRSRIERGDGVTRIEVYDMSPPPKLVSL